MRDTNKAHYARALSAATLELVACRKEIASLSEAFEISQGELRTTRAAIIQERRLNDDKIRAMRQLNVDLANEAQYILEFIEINILRDYSESIDKFRMAIKAVRKGV